MFRCFSICWTKILDARLGAAQLHQLLRIRSLLKFLLLLLPDAILQLRLRVCHVALEVAPDHCHLVEAITQRVLSLAEAVPRGSQVLGREADSAVQSVHGLVCVDH